MKNSDDFETPKINLGLISSANHFKQRAIDTNQDLSNI